MLYFLRLSSLRGHAFPFLAATRSTQTASWPGGPRGGVGGVGGAGTKEAGRGIVAGCNSQH